MHNIPLMFWAVAIFSFVIMALYIIKYKPRIDSPIFFSFILYFTYFILSPILNIVWELHQIPLPHIYDYYPITEVIFLLGILPFIIGYTFAKTKYNHPPSVVDPLMPKPLLINTLIWEVIGIIGYYFWTKQLGVSLLVINPLKLSNYYLQLGETSKKATGYLALSLLFLVPATLMLIELAIRKIYRTITLLLVTLNFVLFLTRGVRYIVLIAGGSIFFYYIKRKSIHIKKGYIFLLTTIFISIFAVIAYLRGAPSLKRITLNSEFLLAFFISSISLFEPTASFTYYIPRFHPFLLGESFLYTLILPIPRLLWPQKPYPEYLKILWKITGGRYFGYAVPNIGEYYANFGIPGVIVFMFFLGFVFSLIYNFYTANNKNPIVLMLYSVFYFFVFQIISRGYFPQVFVQAVYLFLPLITLYMLNTIYLKRSHT